MTGWWRRWFGRRRSAPELDDELQFHVEAHARDLATQGVPPAEARRIALAAFGGIAPITQAARDARRTRWLDDLAADIRYAVRSLLRQPGTGIVIVLTLALGIGANTAIFSIIDATYLRQLPVRDPGRLVLFSEESWSGTISGDPPDGVWAVFSSEVFDFLRGAGLPFRSVAASASESDRVSAVPLASSGAPVSAAGTRATTHLVSGNYFEVMGVDAALGRALMTRDDRPEAAPVAVVSNGYWRHSLDADPHAVGRIVTINRTAFTVVGVMPASFFGERVQGAPDFWVPLARQPEIQLRESLVDRPNYYWLTLIGRLAPEQSRSVAEVASVAALRQFLTLKAGGGELSDATRRRIQGARVVMASGARGVSPERAQNARPLALLFGAVGLVLLIACANVATLLLSRATVRRTEIAIRRALGASGARLVRQWLTESGLLAMLGTCVGVVCANWGLPVLQAHFPSGPMHARLDGPVLLFTASVAVLASLLFGLAPALQAGRVDALAALRSTGRGTRTRRRLFGTTEPFVIAQIAISLVLIVGATLFARTLYNLEHEPLGFDQDRVLLVQINTRLAGYTPDDVGGLYRRLYDRVSALPGVEVATFARYSPFGGHTSSFGARVEGYTPAPDERLRLEAVEVGPNYPQTLGMPLVMGRAIGSEDMAGATRVAMVNEAFVRRFFPTSSPLGHHVQLDDEYQIVGVVQDARFHAARDSMIPFAFIPMLQQNNQMMLDCEIGLRARGEDAGTLAAAARQVVAETDSRVAVTLTRTLREQVLLTFVSDRQTAGTVAALAGLALLLASVGLYGVVSHGVAHRTREIGVRLALGAARLDIVRMLLRETVGWLGIGIAIGGVVLAAAGRLVASQLFGVTPIDPASFATAVIVLVAVALTASVIPATRALRIPPTVALRAD